MWEFRRNSIDSVGKVEIGYEKRSNRTDAVPFIFSNFAFLKRKQNVGAPFECQLAYLQWYVSAFSTEKPQKTVSSHRLRFVFVHSNHQFETTDDNHAPTKYFNIYQHTCTFNFEKYSNANLSQCRCSINQRVVHIELWSRIKIHVVFSPQLRS